MMSEPKFLLELFSGTGSVGRPWREAGHRVDSVDLDSRYNPEECEDILEWDYRRLDTQPPDVIWASVPCENYSIARTRAKTPRNYTLADSLVAKPIEIIKHFQGLNPDIIWFVENPDSSQLWSRAVAWDLYPRVRLDYCQYGKPWRKRTRIVSCGLDLSPLGRRCQGGHKHFILCGGAGIPYTRLAEPYPARLCKEWAILLAPLRR